MVNPFLEINWHPGFAERRKFALSLVFGFPAIALVFFLFSWLTGHSWKPFFAWLAVIGLFVGALLWLLPQIARPFYLVWYLLASGIGFVVSNSLLIAFYYLIITPLGLVLRATGRLSLQKSFDQNARSYWREVKKTVDPKRYYRQF